MSPWLYLLLAHLVADEAGHRSLVSEHVEGTSYFPSRAEMAAGLAAFTRRAGMSVRYDAAGGSSRARRCDIQPGPPSQDQPLLGEHLGAGDLLCRNDHAGGCGPQEVAPYLLVDAPGPDAVAIAVETGADGTHHPAVYLRRGGRVSEHALPPDPELNYEGDEYHRQLAGLLGELL